jgi:hypothetical protein
LLLTAGDLVSLAPRLNPSGDPEGMQVPAPTRELGAMLKGGRVYTPAADAAWAAYVSYGAYGDGSVDAQRAFAATLTPNFGMLAGIHEAGGYDPFRPRPSAAMLQQAVAPLQRGGSARAPLLSLAGVQVLAQQGGDPLVSTQLRPIGANRTTRFYWNADPALRARVMYDVRREPDPTMQRLRLGAPGIDPAVTGFVASPASSEPRAQRPHGWAGLKETGPNEITVEAGTSAPGLLVIADTAAPGWRARRNSTATTWVLVDGAFRGIWLPAGRSQVRMTYAPMSVRLGIFLMLTGLAGLGALTLSSNRIAGSLRPTGLASGTGDQRRRDGA